MRIVCTILKGHLELNFVPRLYLFISRKKIENEKFIKVLF